MLFSAVFHPVFICVVHNCLFVCLFSCLAFDIVCTITCLPYFLQCIYALLNCFFSPYRSLFPLLLFCRFLSVSLPRFRCCFCRCACVIVAVEPFDSWTLKFYFVFAVIRCSLMILLSILTTAFCTVLWPCISNELRVRLASFVSLPVCLLAF